MKCKSKNSGFIALMSAIIISAILLLMVTSLGLTGFYGRYNILDSELKEYSSALAEACVDTVLLMLANDSGYTGGDTITVSGTDTCTIDSTSPSDPRVFIVHSNPSNYYTKLRITVNVSTITVTAWEEIL